MTTAAYGSWTSPLTTAELTSSGVGLSEVQVDGHDAYWLESRPSEGGRTTLMRLRGGEAVEMTPAPAHVRSMVHEYGGRPYAVGGGVVVFSDVRDGRLWLIEEDAAPRAITVDLGGPVLRYADLEVDAARRRVLAVREDHRGDGEAVNTIVSVDLDGAPGEGSVLVDGSDFVAAPRLSPDGARMAWLTWQHPSMPWDATVLWVGDHDAGGASALVGQDAPQSVAEIGWLADGSLAYSTDISGYWNLHVDGQSIHPVDNDCADPAWVFGIRGWCELPDGRIALRVWRDGRAHVALVHRDGQAAVELGAALATVDSMAVWRQSLLLKAGFDDRSAALITLDPNRPGDSERHIIRDSSTRQADPAYVPTPEPVTWTNAAGHEVHGFYYAPRNPLFDGPADERPPLLVASHGGPTSMSPPEYSSLFAFWTSRGIAILDVNYGGSTGRGRAYRERLQSNWGVVDVDDCCSGAQSLADRGLVDGHRMAIFGGSAGGFTTLACLAFRDTFAMGISLYGIGDLETLVRDTHKFESRYCDGLIGPYPQQRELYVERSPINHVDDLDCAMLLLQGADDKVVPPNQATAMADAVRAKGKPVALQIYDGEGHGFRDATNIRASYEAMLSFMGQVFGFTPADDLAPLHVDNL
ncbi:S9 family peptidase [Rudaeicoccus suwonensis]|uniref:Dipeptidyl aminopeptidase/acylaminoacyl peptidase n=1 Tax=Rudaeicoccus suwonensis TaxID=657409 RepID=A0A561E7Q5_9MICO|nr:prolyl oligopeptidase family serine peptidase [Rudaeicoccus suwonensis]TWE11644.1 dipeptidyl aminopeptidase/acylaminoacyl peptidase [Rudaeicoccus suwonensis]